MTQANVVAIPNALPPVMSGPQMMLQAAIEKGATMDVVERLMALYERDMATVARKAFDMAIAAAKAEIPVIRKNREVDFTGNTGKRTNYRHEDLAEIARTVDPVLSKHGLSYRFRLSSNANEPVTVTCILSHRDGHGEENTLSAGRDQSGNKNDIQAIGSTVTFLQRYTLKASLGLAASADDDGRSSGGPAQITDDQAADLRALLDEIGGPKVEALKKGFLKKFGIETVELLPASELKNAHDALNAKRSA